MYAHGFCLGPIAFVMGLSTDYGGYDASQLPYIIIIIITPKPFPLHSSAPQGHRHADGLPLPRGQRAPAGRTHRGELGDKEGCALAGLGPRVFGMSGDSRSGGCCC